MRSAPLARRPCAGQHNILPCLSGSCLGGVVIQGVHQGTCQPYGLGLGCRYDGDCPPKASRDTSTGECKLAATGLFQP